MARGSTSVFDMNVYMPNVCDVINLQSFSFVACELLMQER